MLALGAREALVGHLAVTQLAIEFVDGLGRRGAGRDEKIDGLAIREYDRHEGLRHRVRGLERVDVDVALGRETYDLLSLGLRRTLELERKVGRSIVGPHELRGRHERRVLASIDQSIEPERLVLVARLHELLFGHVAETQLANHAGDRLDGGRVAAHYQGLEGTIAEVGAYERLVIHVAHTLSQCTTRDRVRVYLDCKQASNQPVSRTRR